MLLSNTSEYTNFPYFNPFLFVVMIIVLVLVVGGIAVGVFMMVQRRRTALAEEILQQSEKPKMAPQSAAGTSFSIFYGH